MTSSTSQPKVCEAELGGAADDVFALALALLLIEDDEGRHDTSPAEIACARDRLTYKLHLRARELKNLVETGSIDRAPALISSES